MADVTCIGFALGFALLKCTTPDAAPTGKAPFCAVMDQRGGKLKPSRKDTLQTIKDVNELNAAYDADCARPFPKPIK